MHRAILTGAVCAMAFTLSGCEDPAIRDAKRAVTERLRDPDSAKFEYVGIAASGAVCGFVNARNGYGGMTGLRSFFKPADSYVRIGSEDDEPGYAEAYECACLAKEDRDHSALARGGKPPVCAT